MFRASICTAIERFFCSVHMRFYLTSNQLLIQKKPTQASVGEGFGNNFLAQTENQMQAPKAGNTRADK